MGNWLTDSSGEKIMWEDACLANVTKKNDEPFFVLRAQDKFAIPLVRMWISMYMIFKRTKFADQKYTSALNTLTEMEMYANIKGTKIPD